MALYPVVICGAGIAGLSMSLALSRFGISSCVVEKKSKPADHPRMRGLNVRVMEIMQQWGLADQLMQDALLDHAQKILWLHSMAGEQVGELSLTSQAYTDSPSQRCLVFQDKVEKTLLQACQASSLIEINFGTALMAFAQQDNVISCTLEKEGVTSKVDCQYLIGADGVDSPIRNALAIASTEQAEAGCLLSICVHADLRETLLKRDAATYLFTDEKYRRISLVSVDLDKKWLILERSSVASSDITDEYCQSVVERCIDNDEIECTVLSTHVCKSDSANAQHYRQGNVLLVGGAAYHTLPSSDVGMNTAVLDAHNLAWKLAFVINGEAQEEILDTYEQERQPAADFAIAWSHDNIKKIRGIIKSFQSNNVQLYKQLLAVHSKLHHHRGLDLGFIYQSELIAKRNAAPPEVDPYHYEAQAIPGARAPYCNIVVADKLISILALFDRAYVLLLGQNSVDLTHSNTQLPISETFPLKTYRYDVDFGCADLDFMNLYGMHAHSAVLVRPDGIVAWRGVLGDAVDISSV